MTGFISNSVIRQLKLTESSSNLLAAANTWKKRQENVDVDFGQFVKRSSNYGYQWIPFPNERCECCFDLKGKALTNVDLLRHCKSIRHISHLFKVKRYDLNHLINHLTKMHKINKLQKSTLANMESTNSFFYKTK